MAENLEHLFQGFSRLPREERLNRLKAMANLSDSDLDILEGRIPFDLNLAESFVENVVGYFPLPLAIASYFNIDGRDLAIPMAIEETSVVAACSGNARWIRTHEGSIQTATAGRYIIGQVQFPSVKDSKKAKKIIEQRRSELLHLANLTVPGLVRRGGGVEEITVRELPRPDGDTMMVLHVYCDPCDAMGANLINQVCESLKPHLEKWTDEKIGLCILSNLVDSKITRAEVRIPNVDPVVGHGIEEASLFAECDPYRATTHNKGVLNGIDPVVIATGNDWRAVEAGIHAYAARHGSYQPITTWRMEGTMLVGRFEGPVIVGSVGGVTKLHPTAKVCMRILKVSHAEELSRIIAAIGLVQNLGALRALSTEGIVNGHMSLHAANLAIQAGATDSELIAMKERLFALIKSEKMITLSKAKDALASLRGVATHGSTGDSSIPAK